MDDDNASTISISDLESQYSDEGTGELLPEIQSAIAKGLREFESQYDLSKQPGLMLDLYSYLENALKNCGSPALMNPNYIPGREQAKKKKKVTAYTLYTKEAWANYKEEKKLKLKTDPNYKNDVTPQTMLSQFAERWQKLKPAEKKPYEDKAAHLNNPTTPAEIAAAAAINKKRNARKKMPLSGYQYFIATTKCPPELTKSTEQIKYKAGLWSSLSEDQKIMYKIQSEDTFWKENPDLHEEHQQRIAELMLKEEEKKKMLQNMKYNAPSLKLPNVLKNPINKIAPAIPVNDTKPLLQTAIVKESTDKNIPVILSNDVTDKNIPVILSNNVADKNIPVIVKPTIKINKK